MQNATVTTPLTLDASSAKSRENVPPAKESSDSQTSNTTSSTAYNDGGTLQHPTSDNSQSTSGSNYTPASSWSRDTQVGYNPLESMASVPEASRKRPATPKLKTDWQPDHRESIPSTPSSAVSDSPTHGSKRTASGAIKPPSSTEILSPHETPNGRGHERHNSLSSSRSTVEELSAQLKARLSYAMVKVQNGLETRSIHEIESLAWQLSSPNSVTTVRSRQVLPSPHTTMAEMNRRSRDLTSITSPGYSTATRPGTASSDWSYSDGNLMSQNISDIRDGPVPSLAPAPNLTSSRHSRRSNGRSANSQPPRLSTTLSPTKSRPPHLRVTTPTPQEQEVVDTLIFMSSPANSARFHHSSRNGLTTADSSAQCSPLRTEFAVPAKRANGFQRDGSRSSEEEVIWRSPADQERQTKRRSLGVRGPSAGLRNERDVETLLDEMREGEGPRSSDDGGQTVGRTRKGANGDPRASDTVGVRM